MTDQSFSDEERLKNKFNKQSKDHLTTKFNKQNNVELEIEHRKALQKENIRLQEQMRPPPQPQPKLEPQYPDGTREDVKKEQTIKHELKIKKRMEEIAKEIKESNEKINKLEKERERSR